VTSFGRITGRPEACNELVATQRGAFHGEQDEECQTVFLRGAPGDNCSVIVFERSPAEEGESGQEGGRLIGRNSVLIGPLHI